MAFYDGLGQQFSGWMYSMAFWAIVSILIVIVAFIGLIIRKKRGMDKIVIEMYDIGQVKFTQEGKIDWSKSIGKFDFNITKGGWFKSRFTFMGLIDYGNEKLFRLKDMTPIYDVSHNDYVRINGQNGIVVIRNPNDQKFAVPISKFFLSKNSKLALAEIAPVDLRNSATHAIEETDVEMQTKWQKWAPLITVALISFILIFSILLIAQYGKHNIDVTSETLKHAIDVLGQIGQTRPGGSS